MENKPLLSICIPTYNRSHYLKDCLDTIVIQFENEKIKNSIEVVISDNASPDNTKEVVESYQARFPNIKYFRNAENLGMDKNIINSVQKATGKYAWHIGDDDPVQNGALEAIIAILEKEEIATLTINTYPFIDLPKALKKEKFGPPEEITERMPDPETLLKSGYNTGALGVFVMNRDLWMKVDKTDYELLWACFEFIFKMIGRTKLPLLCLKTPALYVGQDYRWNKGGVSLTLLPHGRNMFEKLAAFGYSQKFIKSRVDMFAGSLLTTTISAKAHDYPYSIKNLVTLYKAFPDYPFQLFLTTLIYFIPNYFFKIAKKVKRTSSL